jgi:hypothetical protein
VTQIKGLVASFLSPNDEFTAERKATPGLKRAAPGFSRMIERRHDLLSLSSW